MMTDTPERKGYLRALDDVQELLDNAASNHAGYTTAPWFWNYELVEQLIMLRDAKETE